MCRAKGLYVYATSVYPLLCHLVQGSCRMVPRRALSASDSPVVIQSHFPWRNFMQQAPTFVFMVVSCIHLPSRALGR